MNMSIYGAGSAPVLDDEEGNRNTELSVAVQACEAIDDVFVTRTMYGRQQPPGAAEIYVAVMQPKKLVLPKYAKNTGKRFFLLALCFTCFLFSILLVYLISRKGLSFPSGLLLGSAFCFFAYELWLVAYRIRKGSAFNIVG